MASGCDGKWLTVNVPVDSSGAGTAEKWLPMEHPAQGVVVCTHRDIARKLD